MRKFKYLGPDTDRYSKGEVVSYDGANSTPDGGVPQAFWLEVVDQPKGGD